MSAYNHSAVRDQLADLLAAYAADGAEKCVTPMCIEDATFEVYIPAKRESESDGDRDVLCCATHAHLIASLDAAAKLYEL